MTLLFNYGLVLFFLVALILFLRANWNSFPEEKKNAVPSMGPAFQASKSGGNMAEITAAISAAIDEYRKTNK
jgi:Na+-transporting methylmalonyl-CoA/oxaloacetate decarboxylase gamma subunit